MAGLRADPGMAPYVAAKHAVVGLTTAAAIGCAAVVYPSTAHAPLNERKSSDEIDQLTGPRSASVGEASRSALGWQRVEGGRPETSGYSIFNFS